MDKAIIGLSLILLVCSIYADSDITGIYAGTNEPLVFGLSNGTGLFDARANCTLRILYGTSLILNYTNLTNLGGGLYYYNWTVPTDTGAYNMFVNCTTPSSENITGGGGFYVVARAFEKSVANGVSRYSVQYSEKYGTNWWDEPLKWLGIVGFVLAIVIFGAYVFLKK
jgi:hypothetical protein